MIAEIENGLGKGEVGGSIPLGSTSQPPEKAWLSPARTTHPPAVDDRTKRDFPTKYGGNPEGTFTGRSASQIDDAAAWLHQNRESLGNLNPIPILKARFGLRAMEAVEASSRAHALQYARAES